MHAYKMYACKRCTPMRCTPMSHPANVYLESGLIFTPPKISHIGCHSVGWHAVVCYGCPPMVPGSLYATGPRIHSKFSSPNSYLTAHNGPKPPCHCPSYYPM